MLRLALLACTATLSFAAVGDIYRHTGRLLDLQMRESQLEATVAISQGIVGPATIYAAGTNRVDGRAIWAFRLGSGETMDEVGFVTLTPNTEGSTVPTIYSLIISPDDQHLYVADNRAGGIRFYTRQPDGSLTNPIHYGTPGMGPLELRFEPSGRHLYYVAQSSIWLLIRDSRTGRLTGPENVFNYTEVSLLRVSNDGRLVIVHSRTQLVTLARNQQTGELSLIDTATIPVGPTAGLDILDLPTSGDIEAFVSNDRWGVQSSLYTFRITRSGLITADQTFSAPVARQFGRIVATRNGVYVSHKEQGIAVFARDTITGRLTPARTMQEWPGNVDTLVLSKGTELLVAARGQGVHVYKRETSCGVGVPEPCAARAVVPLVKKDPTATCRVTREDLERTGIPFNRSQCTIEVYEDEQRSFICTDPVTGVLLGLDRVSTATAHADRLLSFFTIDYEQRIGFSLSHKDKATVNHNTSLMGPRRLDWSTLDIQDYVRISWPRHDDASLITLVPVQGGATLCLYNPQLCCVLPPEYTTRGGSCSFRVEFGYALFVNVWASVRRDEGCLSGYRSETKFWLQRNPPVRDDAVHTGCLVPDLQTPHGLGQSITSTALYALDSMPQPWRNNTLRVTVDCNNHM